MHAALRAVRLAAVAPLAAVALLAAASTAHGEAPAAGEYLHCQRTGDSKIVDVSRATCDEAQALAMALTGVPAAGVEAALIAAGWTPLRASATGFDDSYDIVSTRGLAALWLRRPGEAPDLDGWMAGRELIFSRGPLLPGAAPPKDSALCTSGFLIRLGDHSGGLSAAHCAGTTKSRTTRRRNALLRRPPQPGVLLGAVKRNLARRAKAIDALVLPVPSGAGRPSAAVIDRSVLRPPWFVRGSARPLLGRRVCFTGRTSGVDNCGRIVRTVRGVRGLPCTTITARGGDSGSPVYTAPSADGTVRAVGSATLVVGVLQSMCFTPLQPVLDALGATIVTAPGT